MAQAQGIATQHLGANAQHSSHNRCTARTLAVQNSFMVNEAQKEKIEEDEIVEQIYAAVMEQHLAPGTKLSEAALCKVFGVGRMRIRRSLLLLANRNLVELHPNRGAFVAKPSADQAKEVFEARMTLEPVIAGMAVRKAKPSQIKTLERHLLKESAAHAAGDRKEAIRLSGQFHTNLAQLTNNSVLLQLVKDLVTRSSLIIGMFGELGVINCRDEEHAGIIQALRSGDEALAKELMGKHIAHIQDHVDLHKVTKASTDLMAVFSRS
jgi:DNA-binding GntR family transcriptional regulator